MSAWHLGRHAPFRAGTSDAWATRSGWLFTASVGTGAALWASTYISILALDSTLDNAFESICVGAVLVVAVLVCLIGFKLGDRPFSARAGSRRSRYGARHSLHMHLFALGGRHVAGTVQWNVYGLTVTVVLGLSLGVLAINRANRPVTRWCRHGAAIVLAFMVCTMHYALTASETIVADAHVSLPPDLIPAIMLGFAVIGAVLLVMGSALQGWIRISNLISVNVFLRSSCTNGLSRSIPRLQSANLSSV